MQLNTIGRNMNLLRLSALLFATVTSISAHAFECVLSSMADKAKISRPNGEVATISTRNYQNCAGIRVVSGQVRVIFAGDNGVQESVISSGEVINPEKLKPTGNEWITLAFNQLGNILAGDVQTQSGMSRKIYPDSTLEALSLLNGKITKSTKPIEINSNKENPLIDFKLSTDNNVIVFQQGTSTKVSINVDSLVIDALYSWTAKIDNQQAEGSFIVCDPDAAQTITDRAKADNKSLSSLAKAIAVAKALEQEGFHVDARNILTTAMKIN